jgi:hypothetical protein
LRTKKLIFGKEKSEYRYQKIPKNGYTVSKTVSKQIVKHAKQVKEVKKLPELYLAGYGGDVH